MELDTLLRDAGREPTIDVDAAATHAAGRRRTVVRRAALAGGCALALSAVVVGGVTVLSPSMPAPDIADQPSGTTTPTGATSIGELLRHGADQGSVTLQVAAADIAVAAGTDLVALDWRQDKALFDVTRFLADGARSTWQAATGTPAPPVVANDASVWWTSDAGALHRTAADGGTTTEMLGPDGGYGWLPIGTVAETDQVIVSQVPTAQPVTERRNGLGLIGPDGTFADMPIDGEANVFPLGAIVGAHMNGQAVVLAVATDDALQVFGARIGEVLEPVAEVPRRDERPGSSLGAGVGIVGDEYWIVEPAVPPGGGMSVHAHPLDGGDSTTLAIPANLAAGRWPTGLSVSPSGEVVLLRTTDTTTFEPGTLAVFPQASDGDPWGAVRAITTPGIMSAIRPLPSGEAVTVIPLPALGEVVAAEVQGEPVFVVHEADGQVHVLDARSPHAPEFPEVLAWCETSGMFEDLWHGAMFSPAGWWIAGPAASGMTPYDTAPAGDAVRVFDRLEPLDKQARPDDLPDPGPRCDTRTALYLPGHPADPSVLDDLVVHDPAGFEPDLWFPTPERILGDQPRAPDSD